MLLLLFIRSNNSFFKVSRLILYIIFLVTKSLLLQDDTMNDDLNL